jgi:hypothetical protein
VNDLQLQSRLADLAHDLAPDADPYEQIAGARSLHRRRRRTRLAVAGAAVAVALVAVGVPTAVGTLSGPDRGDVAAPTATLPTEGPDGAADHLRRYVEAVGAALDRLGLDATVPDPEADFPCPDAADALGRATAMYVVEPGGINAGGSTLTGCSWSTDVKAKGSPEERLDLSLRAAFDATTRSVLQGLDESVTENGCRWTTVPDVGRFLPLEICEGSQMSWTLTMLDEDGVGAWVLTSAVGSNLPEGFGTGAPTLAAMWELVVQGAAAIDGPPQISPVNREFNEIADAIAQQDGPLELRASRTPSSDCAGELLDLIATLGIELHEVPVPREGNPDVCGWASSDGVLPMYIGLIRDGDATDRARLLDAAIDATMREDGTCYASEVSGTATRTTLQACSRPAAGGVTEWRLLVDDAGGAGLWEITALLPDEGAAVAPSTSVLALVDLADRVW